MLRRRRRFPSSCRRIRFNRRSRRHPRRSAEAACVRGEMSKRRKHGKLRGKNGTGFSICITTPPTQRPDQPAEATRRPEAVTFPVLQQAIPQPRRAAVLHWPEQQAVIQITALQVHYRERRRIERQTVRQPSHSIRRHRRSLPRHHIRQHRPDNIRRRQRLERQLRQRNTVNLRVTVRHRNTTRRPSTAKRHPTDKTAHPVRDRVMLLRERRRITKRFRHLRLMPQIVLRRRLQRQLHNPPVPLLRRLRNPAVGPVRKQPPRRPCTAATMRRPTERHPTARQERIPCRAERPITRRNLRPVETMRHHFNGDRIPRRAEFATPARIP